jgi:cytochrome c oxidase subunit II
MTLNRWTLAVAVLLAGVIAPAGRSSAPRRIEITVNRFSYSPSEITLKKGEPVVLVLKSSDVTHGLEIKDLNVKMDVKKGQATEINVTPEKTGNFEGKCSHFCGKGHGSMVLAVDVVN